MIHSELFFNRCFDKGKLKGLISWSLRNYGEATTLELVEKLKDVGFLWATKAGISLSIDDLKIPKEKSALLLEAEEISENASKEFLSGNVTTVERLQQLIDAWHRTSELLKQEVVQTFRRSDPLNPVYMMAFSGARGNISQVRQLVGMRGLMADPQGRIIDFPIRSNFREGLTLTEYVISCYGARKGIVDTALRTATSGYLTRRLVDVAQHVVVGTYDCETEQNIVLGPLKQGNKILLPLSERILGRVLGEDILGIATRNTCISQYLALQIQQVRESILVRSPLVCKARTGVCQLCYGWSLAHNELVSIGEAVGIIAAQSIGEPGTQLTMRTFHTGGVFSGEIIDQIQSSTSGIVAFPKVLKGTLVRTSYGKIGFLTREAGTLNVIEASASIVPISFPAQTILFVREGQTVGKNEIVGEYASSATDQDQGIQSTQLVTSPQNGEVFFEDVVILKNENEGENQSYQLGSFWLLKSHFHSTPLQSLGAFNFAKGDLLKLKSSLSTTKVFHDNNSSFFFFQKSDSFQNLVTENENLLDLVYSIYQVPFTNLVYSQGHYAVKFSNNFTYNETILSNFKPFRSICSNIKISFLNLFVNFPVTRDLSSTQISIVFSALNLWFFISNEFFLDVTKSKIFKRKLFEYATIPSSKSTLDQTIVSEKSLKITKRGTYKFLSQTQKPDRTHELKAFYSGGFLSEKLKINQVVDVWPVSSLRFTFTNFYFNNFKNEFASFGNKFTFTEKVTVRFKKTLNIEKIYWYPILPQFSKNFLLTYFTGQKVNTFRFISLLNTKKIQKTLLAAISLLKVSKLPLSSTVLSLFSSNSKLLNKQISDKTLFLESTSKIQLNELTNSSNIPFASIQIDSFTNSDYLNFYPDSNVFNNWFVFSFSKSILPEGKIPQKTSNSEVFTWNEAQTDLLENNVILGSIERKTTKLIEVCKLLVKDKLSHVLSINSKDLLRVNRLNQPVNCFLGSLIRSDDEIIPNSVLKDSGQIISINKNSLLVRKALPILFSSKANFHVFHGDFIEKGLPLITLTYKRLTTGDIVQGIPRIEQLFEARQTTTLLHEQLQELFETYKTRMRLDLAVRKSFQKIQRILIDSIQKVYQSQGVTISDKHLEIIVRQMTSTVRILEGGRTRLLRGELKTIDWVEKVNLSIDIQKAEYEPILLGITKASLETESFISAASFQETTRTLSRAAIEGRTDFLRGLKENVILGHRIPAGTGAPLISYLTKFSSDSEASTDLSHELNFLIKDN